MLYQKKGKYGVRGKIVCSPRSKQTMDMLIYSYLEAVKGKFIWFIALLQQYSSRTQIENRK
nr:MAG TPA: hypothetical protein [Bacteriophage sp.]DAI51713.1 MAG TPA: hypothetical protein [Caudoviricetes sp.]